MLKDIEEGRETKYRAQVLNVVYRSKYSPIANPKLYFLRHSHFTTVDTVLRDNVHLISIEDDVAKFVEVDASVNLLDCRHYPLFSVALSEHVRKYIIIPRVDFDRLVSGIEDDDREVVWMFHTMRCGSTLWSQMFNLLPDWHVISESITLCYTVFHAREECDLQKFSKTKCYEDIVVGWVKMYLQRYPKGHKVFWKGFPIDHHIIPVLRKRFPNHRIVFAYRDALPSAKSYYTAFESIPLSVFGVKMLNMISSLPPRSVSRHLWLWYTNGYNMELCFKTIRSVMPGTGFVEWYVLLWAATVSMMKEFSDAGIPIINIKYEDLQADPKLQVSNLFRMLSIPQEYVDRALQAMDQDSQAGMFLSLENRKKNKSWKRSDDSVERCNRILKAFNLPALDSSTNLANNS